MRKLFIIILFLMLLSPVFVKADGMVIDDKFNLLREHSQIALIDWKDGKQSMLLSIEIDALHDKNAIWIFPIPSDPEKTVIGILQSFPSLRGTDINKEVNNRIKDLNTISLASQIYPLIFLLNRGIVYANEMAIASKGEFEAWQDVTVYEHIEKEGIVTELLGTTSWEGLYQYLGRKGLAVSKDKMSVLEEYIGKNNCFVVSWLTKTENTENDSGYYYKKRIPGVVVNFPTEKPYFPLIPTSVYGSEIVQAHIFLLGNWKADSYDDIKPYVTTKYYYSYTSNFDEQTRVFFSPQQIYTKIDINSPSKLFSEDLYFTKGSPAKVSLDLILLKGTQKESTKNLIGFIIIILVSLLSGAITGKIIFKQGKRFAKIGLWNCLTILGLIIAIIFIRTKEISPELKRLIAKEKVKISVRDLRKISFVILFSVFFIIISSILSWLLYLIL